MCKGFVVRRQYKIFYNMKGVIVYIQIMEVVVNTTSMIQIRNLKLFFQQSSIEVHKK
jgi:hypothetical protein